MKNFVAAHACVMAIAIIALGGCSALPENKSWKEWLPGKRDPKPEVPTRMAPMWTPDILSGVGHTPTRGFGGRIFFFNDRGKPVMVNGDLTIHAFDDNDPAGAQNARRYRFTADQLAQHHSRNDIGSSYSIWVPWDAMGGSQKRITMVTTFQPAEGGRPVQSEAATVLLPGPHSVPPPVITPPTPSLPTTASGETSTPPPASRGVSAKAGLETMTISR